MSDYYHQFLSSMSGVGQNPNINPQDVPPQAHQVSPIGMAGAAGFQSPYQNLGYYTGFPEPVVFNTPKAQRSRRKSAPGLDHVKHRRTRSGCYTCRSRRVKCDESHPICERCRKGKRDCVYPPDAQAPAKSAAASTSKDGAAAPNQPASPTSSHDEDEDDELDQEARLDTIPDEDEPVLEPALPQPFRTPSLPRRSSTASTPNLQRIVTTGGRQGSETPSLEGTRASSPSTSTGTASSLTPVTYQFPDWAGSPFPGSGRAEWTHLPQDVRFYLAYFCEHVTHYHYGMLTDSDDFIRTVLPSMAVRNEALLYAVVGFSAYHFTLRDPNGKMQQFLLYYNKSVTLLLNFLKRKGKHNEATLLTILQLATIEEYLGDWVNLMGHQKAAYEVLTQLFTPENVVETPTSRAILTWYMRFDVFVGMMGGFAAALPEEWFSSLIGYFQSQQQGATASDVAWKIDECSARLRLISREVSVLTEQYSKSEISDEKFSAEHSRLSQELKGWKDGWDPALSDASFRVDLGQQQQQQQSQREQESIVDVSDPPGVLYDGPLFPTTLLACEWHTIVIMHACQTAADSRGDADVLAALANQAYAICQIVETIELWPSSPKGSLVITQACLAVAALFLPHDEKHQAWIRRKFALLESMGYIFPLSMRTRMAQLFGDQSCIRWWLPNDEGFSPILRTIRAFADERNATAISAQSDNLREIRHIFSKMQLVSGGGARSNPTVPEPAGSA